MLEAPEGIGVIVRTAGRDRSRPELERDLSVLLRLWENIKAEADRAKAPALIFKEQDVVIRALRDYYSDDIDEIVLDSDEAYDRASGMGVRLKSDTVVYRRTLRQTDVAGGRLCRPEGHSPSYRVTGSPTLDRACGPGVGDTVPR